MRDAYQVLADWFRGAALGQLLTEDDLASHGLHKMSDSAKRDLVARAHLISAEYRAGNRSEAAWDVGHAAREFAARLVDEPFDHPVREEIDLERML